MLPAQNLTCGQILELNTNKHTQLECFNLDKNVKNIY